MPSLISVGPKDGRMGVGRVGSMRMAGRCSGKSTLQQALVRHLEADEITGLGSAAELAFKALLGLCRRSVSSPLLFRLPAPDNHLSPPDLCARVFILLRAFVHIVPSPESDLPVNTSFS